MTILTEERHALGFLISEAPHTRSRDQVTVLSGQNLDAGAIVGRAAVGAQAAAPIPVVVGTGNGVMTRLRMGPDVQAGSYVIACTAAVAHGGVFSVTAPDGTVLSPFTLTPGAGVASNYHSSHINFTLTDGSTDFIVTDSFTVVVTAAGTPVVVGTGNGAMSAFTVIGKDAMSGAYLVTNMSLTAHGGDFDVVAPDGSAVGHAHIAAGSGNAVVFTSGHINFTITDGSTDFLPGDYFQVIVLKGSGKIAVYNPSGVNGTNDVAGILIDAVDATSADKLGVIIARDAEINWSEVIWGGSVIASEKVKARNDLAALGIIAR